MQQSGESELEKCSRPSALFLSRYMTDKRQQNNHTSYTLNSKLKTLLVCPGLTFLSTV